MSEECRSCGAPIDWASKFPEEFNDQGKQKMMPIDHDSVDDPKGNIEVWREPIIPTKTDAPATVLRFRYLRKGEVPQRGRHRGISHYATCPQADKWRSQPKQQQHNQHMQSRPQDCNRWPPGSNGEAANR